VPVSRPWQPVVRPSALRWLAALAVAALLLTALVPSPAAVAQEAVVVSDHTVESFDGTPLAATLFLPAGASADAPVPLVLRTHGWGGTRETSPGSAPDVDPGAGTLAKLLDAGYAVLTWDSRGFGCSGGQVRIDDPDVEGRDVSALIDWAVANAPIATDAEGDPIVGMTGGSYAGGIQLSATAVDGRLDALAPEIAWSDLRYSLYGGEVTKQGWIALLYGLGTATGTALGLDPSCAGGPTADALDPAIHQGVTEFLTTGRVTDDTQAFFAKSSVAGYGDDRPVQVPTLVLQGSVDTLFDLADGYGIYEHVRAQGVDARFVAFCGGHVECPRSYVDADDRAVLDDAILRWFARHLRGEAVDVGAPISYRTNEGIWRDAERFTGDAWLQVAGAATGLPVVPAADVPNLEELAALFTAGPPRGIPALPTTSAKPSHPADPRAATFEVAAAGDEPLEVLGVPQVRLAVEGVTTSLEEAMAPLGEGVSALPRDEAADLLIGSTGPVGAVAGGVARGAGGDGDALGGVDGSVNLFVKLVHREAGEVLNLQEGAIRVDLAEDTVTVDVPMPGLAYTVPPGHHLDLEVSTASLMHATGRTPALVDVEVAAEIPLATAPVPPDPDRPGRPDAPGRPGDTPGRSGEAPGRDEEAPDSDGDGPGRSSEARGRPAEASDARADGRTQAAGAATALPASTSRELPATGALAAVLGLAALASLGSRRRR
jgi:ABC-2 type transport system ATP-binding protein